MKRLTGIIMTGALLTLTLAEPILAQAGEIKERQKHQQKRIDEGVTSGELTKKETLELEAEQAKIQKKSGDSNATTARLGPRRERNSSRSKMRPPSISTRRSTTLKRIRYSLLCQVVNA